LIGKGWKHKFKMGHRAYYDYKIIDLLCPSSAFGYVGLVVGIVIGVITLYRWFSWQNTKTTLPPGSLGLPFLGESLEFLSAYKANRFMEDFINPRMAKYGQVFKTHILFSSIVFLGPPEGNKFLFSNENKLVQASWPSSINKLFGRGSIAVKIGEEHKQGRQILSSFFSPIGLQSFVPRMHETTRAHFEQFWEKKDEITAGTLLKKITLSLAIDLFMSIKEGPESHALAHDMNTYLAGFYALPLDFLGTTYHKARLAREKMLHTLDIIIHQKRKDMEEGKISPRQDLLSILISTLDDQGHLATNEEIKDNILVLLFGGHDTTSSTLALVLKYLFLNPHCLQEVIKEQKKIVMEKVGDLLCWDDTRKMKYTWQVIQETMRIQPILHFAPRETLKEIEYGGFTIPKGWKVAWSGPRSHLSPQFFPNPERFDPSRFEGIGLQPFTYVPFGGGPQMCPGSEFARTEMVVFLHHLVLNYEWSMIDPFEKIAVDPFPTFQKGLQLRIHKKD
jgi:cytochrome P450